MNATSITIDNVEPLPLSEGKAGVSFRCSLHHRCWRRSSPTNPGNWQANLQKAHEGHCHVMGVAVRSGDSWIKAINTDFEVKQVKKSC